MSYLSIKQVLVLHEMVISQSGGSAGIRDLGALESAIAQPQMTFDGIDLYLTIAEKAAALAHSLVQNHPFVDGNKRIGHAAMEVFLVLRGYEIDAIVDEQEQIFLNLASGKVERKSLADWISSHLIAY